MAVSRNGCSATQDEERLPWLWLLHILPLTEVENYIIGFRSPCHLRPASIFSGSHIWGRGCWGVDVVCPLETRIEKLEAHALCDTMITTLRGRAPRWIGIGSMGWIMAGRSELIFVRANSTKRVSLAPPWFMLPQPHEWNPWFWQSATLLKTWQSVKTKQ